MLSRGDLAWLAVAAYALHVMEEQILDWPAAARRSIQLSIDYTNYRVITTVYLILGAVAAYLFGSLPVLALGFAAFLLINALYFHIWPMIRMNGLAPGIITAVFLFLPIAIAQYYVPGIPARDYWISIVIGVVLVVFPLALLHYRSEFAGGASHGGDAPRKRRARR
jgi:Na+/H+-translocating membrane pyrophosphatase